MSTIEDTTWVAWDDTAAPLRRAITQKSVDRQPGQRFGVVVQDVPAYSPAQLVTWQDNLSAAQAAALESRCNEFDDTAAVVRVLDSRDRRWRCRVLSAEVDIFDIPGNVKSLRCVWILLPVEGPT